MGNELTVYFDCVSGISGDMTLGAIVDLGVDVDYIKRELKKLDGLGEFDLVAGKKEKNGLHGIDLTVVIEGVPDDGHQGLPHDGNHSHEGNPHEHDDGDGHNCDPHEHGDGNGNNGTLHDHDSTHDHGDAHGTSSRHGESPHAHHHHHEHHEHRTYKSIRENIEASGIAPGAKRIATDIFTAIGKAEAAVHGKSLDEVAFHEVGAADSIIDIVGTAVGLDAIGAEIYYTSPVHDGSGEILCQHGIIPVPVPAVVEMAKFANIPLVIESDIGTELVTPTGYGILAGLSAKYATEAEMTIEKSGLGFGKRETGKFGAVRLLLGRS